jgi:hypothetical protein
MPQRAMLSPVRNSQGESWQAGRPNAGENPPMQIVEVRLVMVDPIRESAPADSDKAYVTLIGWRAAIFGLTIGFLTLPGTAIKQAALIRPGLRSATVQTFGSLKLIMPYLSLYVLPPAQALAFTFE